jgi:PBP1b-binding outer membrane lipoprotein LpoB
MKRLAMVLLAGLLLTGCRGGRWVEDVEVPVVKCRGGTVNTERRVTDVTVLGRTRTTTTRTDACLD